MKEWQSYNFNNIKAYLWITSVFAIHKHEIYFFLTIVIWREKKVLAINEPESNDNNRHFEIEVNANSNFIPSKSNYEISNTKHKCGDSLNACLYLFWVYSQLTQFNICRTIWIILYKVKHAAEIKVAFFFFYIIQSSNGSKRKKSNEIVESTSMKREIMAQK